MGVEMRVLTIAIAVLALTAGGAEAREMCGATVRSVYGETRATFGSVVGACRPDGYCSAVLALADPARHAAFAQQLRVARPLRGAPYQVELTAAAPLPATPPTPMDIHIGYDFYDLERQQAPTSPGGNEFRISNQSVSDRIVVSMRRSRIARWTYQGESGQTTVEFNLNGVTAALAWIECMGAR
jgi:hypothetical protein